MEKESIKVVGEGKEILDLLSLQSNITEVLSYEEYYNELSRSKNRGTRHQQASFVIIGDGIMDESLFERTLIARERTPKDEIYIKTIFNLSREKVTPPKFIGFGTGALFLANLNRAQLLYNIENHKDTIHSTSFIMPDGKILEFDVHSNHDNLIVPTPNSNFEVLAFSTFNNSPSYTKADGSIFKASRDFIEIESVKFRYSNSYCFCYDVPDPNDKVLTDLTLQLLKK